jgi:hypothetical protein
MDIKQQKINRLREKLMLTRRVVCTGNPNNPDTLASGIRTLFPDTTFVHLSNGWDFKDQSINFQQRLKTLFSTHNTFINASYIGPGVQSYLLELCNQSVTFCDVFNIGSTHEYDGLGTIDYQQSKLDLRHNSLRLNSYRFQTHHIILGGIKLSGNPETHNWLDVSTICQIIPWILNQKFKIPLITIDQAKMPW